MKFTQAFALRPGLMKVAPLGHKEQGACLGWQPAHRRIVSPLAGLGAVFGRSIYPIPHGMGYYLPGLRPLERERKVWGYANLGLKSWV